MMKLAFLSLPAEDYEASLNFYRNVLELPVIKVNEGPPHRYTDFELGSVRLKVYEWLEPWLTGHFLHFMIEVEDLDMILKKVDAAGYETAGPDITKWQGRVASIKDPFGNTLNLLDASQQGSS